MTTTDGGSSSALSELGLHHLRRPDWEGTLEESRAGAMFTKPGVYETWKLG